MKFLLLGALAAAALTIDAPAQQPCNLTKDQLPAMRKLRLGMERTEFEKHYKGANILVMNRHAVDKTDLENLDGIAFDFHDGRLYFIEFDYNGKAVKWTSVKDFARKTSDDLKIPFDAWRFEPGDFLGTMTCADFFVKVNSKDPTLTLRDTVADKAKRAAERKAAENQIKPVKF